MILVQTLGTGCRACDRLAANARQAVEELGIDARVEQVGDINVIISLEALAVPALAINGHVMVNGRVPSVAKIKQMLTVHDAIAAEEQARSDGASGSRGREDGAATKTGEKVPH
jgi:small redox-active disulfide protein 2